MLRKQKIFYKLNIFILVFISINLLLNLYVKLFSINSTSVLLAIQNALLWGQIGFFEYLGYRAFGYGIIMLSILMMVFGLFLYILTKNNRYKIIYFIGLYSWFLSGIFQVVLLVMFFNALTYV